VKRSTVDPYADLGEVYAEETSPARIAVKPTAKAPTDEAGERDTDAPLQGMSVVS
jgi:hypothetical protein